MDASMQGAVNIEDLYAVGAVLGQGQNAKVYKAINKSTGRPVALKAMPNSPETSKHRAREIEIWKSVKHANCIQLHDIHMTKDHVYVATDLLTGDTLLDRMLEKSRFSEKEAANTIVQILHGVQHLHSQGICHRDLQPQNIMYATDAADSLVKIVDYGLARRVGSDLDVMWTVCGTPAYVAPEVFAVNEKRDQSASYGLSCDVWSAGVLLFCMLSGQQPFDKRGGLVGLVRQITEGRYSLSGEAWRNVSQEAKDLVKAMMTVDPEQRITLGECLAHPWILRRQQQAAASPIAAQSSLPRSLVRSQSAASLQGSPGVGKGLVRSQSSELLADEGKGKGRLSHALRTSMSRLVPFAFSVS